MAQSRPSPAHSPKPSLSPSLKRLVETLKVEDAGENTADAESRQALASVESEIGQASYGDVWERMRQNYRLDVGEHARINREMRHFRNQPGYVDLIQERARPYIHFILNELEKRDMPMEIALLPAIESTYHPFAYSSGRAAGLWQFIPSTGRSCGLKQTSWYDGRRDVVASTRAALDYLKRLNETFDGDWELALAAYNAGAGTVQKAIRRNRASDKPTDYWSLQLPRETSRYVPRLLALSRLFGEPEHYGLTLQKIPDEPYFRTLELDSQLDLKLAARLSGVSLDDLQLLNPGYTHQVTPPDGPNRLILPQDKADGFLTQLAGLSHDERLQWSRYRIKRGDSLSQIAQHHHISVAFLKTANNLRSDTIQAGRHLMIPNWSPRTAGNTRSNKPRNQDRRNGRQQHYVVQKGDSLWSIAKAYQVDHMLLAKWNDLSPNTLLQPGQRLVIRPAKPAADLLSSADLQSTAVPSQVSYEVQAGDSLSRIADRFSVTIPQLKKWNSLPGELLQPGQQLKLFVMSEQQTL